MQLEKLLHSQGFGTRKECRALVRNGWLEIGGVVVEDPFLEVDPEGFEFTVDDQPWRYREKAYLMIHKPGDYECSHKPKHHRSIFTLLPEELVNRDVQCVGRLDEDTTGLLLMTDDELNKVWILRKVLAPLSPIDSMELLLSKLNSTKSNKDFLRSMEMGGR